MMDLIEQVNAALFAGIRDEERKAMLGCIGHHIGTLRKGDSLANKSRDLMRKFVQCKQK